MANSIVLGDAFFNAEKKRRKYNPDTGYYIDEKTGAEGPDVNPYERPRLLARMFSPEARSLIDYNQSWVNKPREARLDRNIQRDTAKEMYAASSPETKAAIGSPENQWAINSGQVKGQALSALEKAKEDTANNLASAQSLADLANAQSNETTSRNNIVTQQLLSDAGVPADRAKTAALEQKNAQKKLIADSMLIDPRTNLESVELAERLKDVSQVSPYRRDALIGGFGNQIQRQQRVEPAVIDNEVTAAANEAMKLRGEAARLPSLNNAALDQALVAETLAGVDATNRGLVGDTRRNTLIGDSLRAQHMGFDPVEAMSSDLGVYGRLNDAGDLEVRQSLLGYDDMGEPRMQPSQSTYTINGQPVPAPPQQLSSPLGVIPSGAARGPVRAPIGAVPATSPLATPAPSRAMLMPSTAPIASTGWNVNDMIKSAAARAGVRQLPPEEKAQSEAMFKSLVNDWKSLPAGGQARTEAIELLNEALADEAGILRETIGDSTLFKSAKKTVQSAIDKDPIIAERVNNLKPYQIARIREKVWRQLVEKGLIKNDRVN